MKKITTLKTLLVGLLALGATSAWADATETVTVLGPIDYSTTSMNWKVVGGSVSYSDGYAKHTQDGGSGNRSAYLDFGIEENIDDNWTVEFDASLKPGSDRNDQQIAVTGAKTTYTNNTSATGKMYFAVKEESNGGTTYTVKIGDQDVATGVTLENGTNYHFTVTYDGKSSVTAKIGETKYVGTVAIEDIGKLRGIHSCVARSNGATTFDNITVTKEVAAGSVDIPSASITAVDGIKRTVTFTCPTEGVSYSYSTDNGTTWTNGNYVTISENTDIIVKATKGANSAQSGVLSFQAGTEITLNTPTWTKTGYADGVSTVTLADNQSSVLLNPATTIKYQINDGDAQAYSTAISINDGETLKYWSEATGYTNSEIYSVTATTPCAYPTIFTEEYNGNNAAITVNTEEVVATIGGSSTPYYFMNANDTHVSDYLITSNTGASNWLLRSTGVYAGNSVNYALTNVQKNDIVTIAIIWGTEKPEPTSNDGTLNQWNSTPGSAYVFKVTSTMGNFRFSLGRYASVKSIKVQRETVKATIGSNGYSTFASAYAVEIPSGVIAYTAKVNEAGTAVNFTKIEGTAIPANTGVLLEGTPGDITLTVVDSASPLTDNDFIAGTGAAPSDNTKTYFAMVKDSDPLAFGKIAADVVVPANKAYLAVAAGAFVPESARLTVTFDGEATGIKTVENAKAGKAIYNLNGQRVDKAQKGLYIVNGKKTIVK